MQKTGRFNVLQRARDRRELADGIDTDHAIDLIEGPIVYRYMIRGDTFAQHDLDAILDLIVAGLTRPPDAPPDGTRHPTRPRRGGAVR